MVEYQTIIKSSCIEIIEKKSKFICNVMRVYCEREALQFINKIKEKYKGASHNVFAYIAMDGIEITRASDDGEPQGTAGIPVLEVIKRENLKNICVVVTRYFGGTLLGAPGLVRAYTSSARDGINEAGICTMTVYEKISVIVDYNQYGKVQNIMLSIGNTILDVKFTENVEITLKIRHDKVDESIKTITDITSATAIISMEGKFYDIM